MDTNKRKIQILPHQSGQLITSFVLISIMLQGILLLSACNAAVPSVPATATLAEITTAAPTNTVVPSPTVTPNAPRVILLASPGHDEVMAEKLEVSLAALARGEGLRFEKVSNLSPADLQQGIKLVVALPPDSGISKLSAASPETQFLAIGIPDIEADGNISTINSLGSSPDQTGFAAGYLAAVITPDWRVGVLSEQGTLEGNAAQQGYINGVIFFCGLCRPVYPPFPIPGYPLSAQLTDTSSETDWQAAIGNMQTWDVGTIFVDPEIASEGLYQEIADTGIDIIGTGEPPAGLKDHWVASIEASDPVEAMSKLWPDLLAGKGGNQVNTGLSIHSVNPDLFSPGRQALVEEMLGELSQGYIDTGVGSDNHKPGN